MNRETGQKRAATNWTVPRVILTFCVVAYDLSTTFERVPPMLKRSMQPSDFPQLVILLIAVLAG